jgi:ketosteroid isomerase-like protein
MSEENVEVVRRHIEAWRAQDAARALSYLDPHVVLDVSRTDAIDTTAYGHEETAELFRRYAGTFEDFRWEVEQLRDLGPGTVLAVLTETGRGKGSGVPVDRPLASLYTLIDGKIVRVTTFSSEEGALEAVGWRE